MIDNKFMNLKKEYKDFIKKTASQIKELKISDELTKKECDDIFNLYQNIYSSISNTKLNINDINHIIMNYNKENEDVELIKKFIKIKNMFLIKQIFRSSHWDPFIAKLGEQIKLDDIKIPKKTYNYLLKKGVYRLLKTTIDQFRGCWEIAEFKDNKLKKIEIIEPDHIEFLINYLKNKIK